MGVLQHCARAGLSCVLNSRASASGWSDTSVEQEAVRQWSPRSRQQESSHWPLCSAWLARRSAPWFSVAAPPGLWWRLRPALACPGPPADTRRSWFIMHNLYSENIHNNSVAKKSFRSIFGFVKSNSHVSPECRRRSVRELGGSWAERDWLVGGVRLRCRAWLLPGRRCAVPRGGARDSSFICGGGRRD